MRISKLFGGLALVFQVALMHGAPPGASVISQAAEVRVRTEKPSRTNREEVTEGIGSLINPSLHH